jgi:hypothetical protein
MLKKIILIMLLMSWCQSTVIAQTTVTTNPATVYSSLSARKYKIILNSNKQIVARSLDSLKGNTLYTSGKNGPQEVSVDVIKTLKVAKEKRPVARGMLFGALSGAGSGALLGLASYEKPDPNSGSWSFDFGPGFSAFGGGLLGLLAGTLTGTIIGASSNRYIRHDFSKVPSAEKSALMSRILIGSK